MKLWPCGFKIEYTHLGFALVGAVWLGLWNSDHAVLKFIIRTSASPRRQRSYWGLRVTKDAYFSLLTCTKQLLLVTFCDTLKSLINIALRLLISTIFSHAYALIREPTFISFNRIWKGYIHPKNHFFYPHPKEYQGVFYALMILILKVHMKLQPLILWFYLWLWGGPTFITFLHFPRLRLF